MKRSKLIDAAFDKAIEEVDLFNIAAEGILQRKDVEDFLNVAFDEIERQCNIKIGERK